MKNQSFVHSLNALAFTAILAAGVLLGCSKKQAQAPDTSTTVAADAASNAPAADAPAAVNAQAPPQPAPGPILDVSQMGDAKAAMAEADAALRQREYEKAVRTMLALQQAQLSAQQAEAARQQMYALQRNLANAIAAGDPNAKAAADILRAGRGY